LPGPAIPSRARHHRHLAAPAGSGLV
jgi:hypothetical protein